MALAAGRDESCAAALDAADGLLGHLPADQEPGCQLAAAMIRLTAALRTGDLAAAAAAAASAELCSARSRTRSWPGIPISADGCCPAAEPSSCGPATWTRPPACSRRRWPPQTASGRPEPADCLAYLALAEAWRGRLRRAAELADRATAALAACGQRPPGHDPHPAALIARAWVHLERNELREARRCVKQADAALDRARTS